MSVDRTDYIIYGWKMPYENMGSDGKELVFYDGPKYRSMTEGHKGEDFSLIVDGMSGEYTVFGFNLSHGGDKYEGWDFVQLDFSKVDVARVKERFKEVFEKEPETEPTLFIFSHFS